MGAHRLAMRRWKRSASRWWGTPTHRGAFGDWQQQRFSIARAIVTGPAVAPGGEPPGNSIRPQQRDNGCAPALNWDEGITVVMITHDGYGGLRKTAGPFSEMA